MIQEKSAQRKSIPGTQTAGYKLVLVQLPTTVSQTRENLLSTTKVVVFKRKTVLMSTSIFLQFAVDNLPHTLTL